MASAHSFHANVHAKPPEPLRLLFKKLQKSGLKDIELDDSILTPSTGRTSERNGMRLVKYLKAHDLQRTFRDFLEHSKEQALPPFKPVPHATFYEIDALPGLFIFPTLLPPAVQIEMLNRLLHRDLSNPSHNTNLHMHHFFNRVTDECASYVKGDDPSDSPGSKVNHESFFAMDTSTKIVAKDPAVHKDITIKDVLDKKLRWITLGGQYDWTAKRYPTKKPPPFPADIKLLLRQLFSDIDPQAAILNLYRPGDTLSVHRDVSEECDQPLVSISIGCDAIFIIGNEDGSTVASLRLRSGDAIYMSGSSRFAWHAVPKVLPNTCPNWLQDWPGTESEESIFETWRGWMGNKRINLNVRQITAASYG